MTQHFETHHSGRETGGAAELPVAVIGGGPIGLAAAAQLIERGMPVRVYEAGATVGANVRDWGHVRIFSPWRYSIDAAARKLLAAAGGGSRRPTACRPARTSTSTI